MAPAVALDVVGEAGGNDRGGRYTVFVLHRAGKLGDTRRTTVSTTNAKDYCVTTMLDFSP